VTEFLSELNALADRLGVGIILSAHASKSQDGTPLRVTSGSTAWPNACRSVLELKAADDQSGPSLKVVKANHAATGTTIPLVWQDKLLVSEAPRSGGLMGSIDRRTCERVFLDLLDKTKSQGRYVNDSKTTGNYAPKAFVKHPDREGYALKDFEGAMERLFASDAITLRSGGRRGSEHAEIVRSEHALV
jgi:RecA-family ATPase